MITPELGHVFGPEGLRIFGVKTPFRETLPKLTTPERYEHEVETNIDCYVSANS